MKKGGQAAAPAVKLRDPDFSYPFFSYPDLSEPALSYVMSSVS
jgi:hypothetical protein